MGFWGLRVLFGGVTGQRMRAMLSAIVLSVGEDDGKKMIK